MSPEKPKDPSVARLNELGYNVIKVPRAGVDPLNLIARDKETQQLNRIGRLQTLWKSTSSDVPLPGPPNPVASLNNTSTSKLDLGFGLDLLKGALAIFGASAPALDLSHTSAKSLQFNYTNVTSVSIDTDVIGDFLTEGTLSVNNPAAQQWIVDPESVVYVLTEVLRSTSITVTATDSNGNGVSLSAPQINGIVGGSINVKPSTATNTAITFESTTTPPTPANFAFKAIRLIWVPTPNAVPGIGMWKFANSGVISFGVVSGGEAPAVDEAPSGPVVFDTGTQSCLVDL